MTHVKSELTGVDPFLAFTTPTRVLIVIVAPSRGARRDAYGVAVALDFTQQVPSIVEVAIR